jgi:hypothetical protein
VQHHSGLTTARALTVDRLMRTAYLLLRQPTRNTHRVLLTIITQRHRLKVLLRVLILPLPPWPRATHSEPRSGQALLAQSEFGSGRRNLPSRNRRTRRTVLASRIYVIDDLQRLHASVTPTVATLLKRDARMSQDGLRSHVTRVTIPVKLLTTHRTTLLARRITTQQSHRVRHLFLLLALRSLLMPHRPLRMSVRHLVSSLQFLVLQPLPVSRSGLQETLRSMMTTTIVEMMKRRRPHWPMDPDPDLLREMLKHPHQQTVLLTGLRALHRKLNNPQNRFPRLLVS